MSNPDFPIYVLAYAIAVITAIFATRAIFSIPKFLKIQKAQLQMLAEIALKQGVNPGVVKHIIVQHDADMRTQTNEEAREEVKSRKDAALEQEALSYPKE